MGSSPYVAGRPSVRLFVCPVHDSNLRTESRHSLSLVYTFAATSVANQATFLMKEGKGECHDAKRCLNDSVGLQAIRTQK